MLFRSLPGEVVLQLQALRELLREPPAGARFAARLACGHAHGHERTARGLADNRRVVPLEVDRLGQHDVGVVDLLDRHDVDDREQVQLLDRFPRAFGLRNALDHVLPVGDPALDGVRLLGERGVDQAVRDAHVLRRERIRGPRAVGATALGLGELRQVEAAPRNRNGKEDAALASPAAEQRGEQRHRARALRVVAVPRGVAARVHDHGRLRFAHGPRRGADLLGGQVGDGRGPFGRELAHVLDEPVEAERMRGEVLLVVQLLGHEHVHPREQQRDVGARPDREPPVGLRRGGRVARVHRDEFRASRKPLGEGGDLRREHVLPDVAADEHDHPCFLEVHGFGRAEALAERELVADVARTAALREGGLGAVRRAVGLHERAEEARADAVREERDGLGAVLLADREELFREEVERFVPRRALELALAALAGPEQRVREPVGIVQQVHARIAARAEPAAVQRVIGIALDPDDLAVHDAREDAAAPETHLADRGDLVRPALTGPARRDRPGVTGSRNEDAGACARHRSEESASRDLAAHREFSGSARPMPAVPPRTGGPAGAHDALLHCRCGATEWLLRGNELARQPRPRATFANEMFQRFVAGETGCVQRVGAGPSSCAISSSSPGCSATGRIVASGRSARGLRSQRSSLSRDHRRPSATG